MVCRKRAAEDKDREGGGEEHIPPYEREARYRKVPDKLAMVAQPW